MPWSVEQRINCLELMMKYALGWADIEHARVRTLQASPTLYFLLLRSYKYSGLQRRCPRSHTALLSCWPAAITTAHTGPFMLASGLNCCCSQPTFPECQCSRTVKYSSAVVLATLALSVCVCACVCVSVRLCFCSCVS